MIQLGVFVSPVARIALFPTIGITTKTTPDNQGIMYSLINGNDSVDAPISVKIESSAKKLSPATQMIIKATRSRLSVVSRWTLC